MPLVQVGSIRRPRRRRPQKSSINYEKVRITCDSLHQFHHQRHTNRPAREAQAHSDGQVRRNTNVRCATCYCSSTCSTGSTCSRPSTCACCNLEASRQWRWARRRQTTGRRCSRCLSLWSCQTSCLNETTTTSSELNFAPSNERKQQQAWPLCFVWWTWRLPTLRTTCWICLNSSEDDDDDQSRTKWKKNRRLLLLDYLATPADDAR